MMCTVSGQEFLALMQAAYERGEGYLDIDPGSHTLKLLASGPAECQGAFVNQDLAWAMLMIQSMDPKRVVCQVDEAMMQRGALGC